MKEDVTIMTNNVADLNHPVKQAETYLHMIECDRKHNLKNVMYEEFKDGRKRFANNYLKSIENNQKEIIRARQTCLAKQSI